MSLENLIKDQSIFSLVIISLILITLSLDQVWISLGENWCWSSLSYSPLRRPDTQASVGHNWGLKGLTLRSLKLNRRPVRLLGHLQ